MNAVAEIHGSNAAFSTAWQHDIDQIIGESDLVLVVMSGFGVYLTNHVRSLQMDSLRKSLKDQGGNNKQGCSNKEGPVLREHSFLH